MRRQFVPNHVFARIRLPAPGVAGFGHWDGSIHARHNRRTALTAAPLVASVAATSAWDEERYYGDEYRRPGPVLGFVGEVVVGTFKIATVPLALIARRDGRRDYDRDRHSYEGVYMSTPEVARDYYGANACFYGPPPRHRDFDGR